MMCLIHGSGCNGMARNLIPIICLEGLQPITAEHLNTQCVLLSVWHSQMCVPLSQILTYVVISAAIACRQGQASFGDAGVFVEKYVQRARHIEIQIFGDGKGLTSDIHKPFHIYIIISIYVAVLLYLLYMPILHSYLTSLILINISWESMQRYNQKQI